MYSTRSPMESTKATLPRWMPCITTIYTHIIKCRWNRVLCMCKYVRKCVVRPWQYNAFVVGRSHSVCEMSVRFQYDFFFFSIWTIVLPHERSFIEYIPYILRRRISIMSTKPPIEWLTNEMFFSNLAFFLLKIHTLRTSRRYVNFLWTNFDSLQLKI